MITAAITSPAESAGRLPEYTASPASGSPYAAATAPRVTGSIRSIVPAATRNNRASSRFDPISSGTSPPRPDAKADSGAAGTTDPSTTGANGRRLSASDPHRAGSGAVCTSVTRSDAALTSLSSGTPARAERSAGTPSAAARYCPTICPCETVSVCAPAPLSAIACANNPEASGIDSNVVTLIAPADSPATVTRAGSPPNNEMLSCTHRSAAIWSSSPRLTIPSSRNRNPSAASR